MTRSLIHTHPGALVDSLVEPNGRNFDILPRKDQNDSNRAHLSPSDCVMQIPIEHYVLRGTQKVEVEAPG